MGVRGRGRGRGLGPSLRFFAITFGKQLSFPVRAPGRRSTRSAVGLGEPQGGLQQCICPRAVVAGGLHIHADGLRVCQGKQTQGMPSSDKNDRGCLYKLEVTNFKSYAGNLTIGPFKDFTCVIGPNGSGAMISVHHDCLLAKCKPALLNLGAKRG
jgi:hypothetical protein